MKNQFFASTARGFEELTKSELIALGAENCAIAQGGVNFEADEHTLYQCLLWSRLSSRILLPLITCKVITDMDLYAVVMNYPWEKIFDSRCTLVVDFTGTNSAIRHSQFGAMRVKDGIVDHFEKMGKARPNVDKILPDIRLNVFLKNNDLVLSLDLSGKSLHQRGYREDTGNAPLRETLASIMLLRSGWQPTTPLIDPMCGSGTLLIEGAMLAMDIAPNLNRTHWGFDFWLGHNPQIWQEVLSQARERAEDVANSTKTPKFYGFDVDPKVIRKAQANACNAGVEKWIKFKVQDVANLTNPCPENEVGMVICNPPYGERLGTMPSLIALYSILGEKLKTNFGGWRASILSSDESLLDCIRMRAERQFKVKNGQLDCLQKNYVIRENLNSSPANSGKFFPYSEAGTESAKLPAEDFANRLQKNRKKIEKWAQGEGIDAYRLYDADLPEYNFALDVYGDYAVIQEYAPPKTIDENKARQRIVDAISATLRTLNLATDKLILKVRQKQKSKIQYDRLGQKGEYF